ncbi:aldolase [Acuticoccus sp. MNP-M23]|uniref:3-oxo-tetronate 4-phosphate decarboxylase n=1 Tax=Acuticoccus sp. MNP-M23 TaxID=3072793 RepID=UPI00281578B6|nr:3-oxo-tetronate 4-phosphate decarboxylase [Acuticoccus sp. MNP-M23]WMS44469.1 aldolase [Acuticoccus sp. MNP-M23]
MTAIISAETRTRDQIVRFAELLYMRGYAHGTTGNISARVGDVMLVTPTNSCMGLLDAERISAVAADGSLLSGDKPSKETFLHLAMYEERANAAAVVHLHSTHSVAVSILADTDPDNALPPLTAYHHMKVGRLPLIPYVRPGDMGLADKVRAHARSTHAMLLANHGPVVAGKSLMDAVAIAEELEETAKLTLLTHGRAVKGLCTAHLAELDEAFPS